MHSRALPPLTCAALLLSTAWASTPHDSADVKQGKQACYVVRLPHCWHDADGKNCIGYQESVAPYKTFFYDIRQSREDPATLLIASRHLEQPTPVYVLRDSPERYAIRLGHPIRILPATEDEWKQGRAVTVI
jgi:hypothetical protein